MILNVKDWSQTPGGRYRSDGPWSAQEYREDVLEPAFRDGWQRGEAPFVVLDGCAGFTASWLEEAFGGLVESIPMELLSFVVRCEDEPDVPGDIRAYIAKRQSDVDSRPFGRAAQLHRLIGLDFHAIQARLRAGLTHVPAQAAPEI